MLWNYGDRSLANWLESADDQLGWCGFEIGSRPDSAWLLHAMYESGAGPAERTYDDEWREAHIVESSPASPITEIFARGDSTVTGIGLGRSDHPGPGWRRLSWTGLAERLGEPAVPEGTRPSYRSLPGAHPGGSWPVHIRPPAEGSLDRESWLALVDVLIQWCPAGMDTPCSAFFSPAVMGHHEPGVVVTGRLGDAAELYDHADGVGSPSNFWPDDRSWVTWTDWDLCGTKIAGSTALVDTLIEDPGLEVVRLNWC